MIQTYSSTIRRKEMDAVLTCMVDEKIGPGEINSRLITGVKEFFGYDFFVTPDVLIPKPDTEILVERAVELILEKMESRPTKLLTVCDMCTGSGCIALAVLRTLTDTYKIPYGDLPSFTLVDISEPALEVAKQNAKNLAADYSDKIHFVRSNLFEQFSLTGGWSFDLILRIRLIFPIQW